MPTIYREGAISFSFYSGDGREPPHVHARYRRSSKIKIWLVPEARISGSVTGLARKPRFEGDILAVVERRREELLAAWNKCFGATKAEAGLSSAGNDQERPIKNHGCPSSLVSVRLG